MEKVVIIVKSLCCGNEKIDIYFDDYRVSFYASYIGQEPMASLVQAVYELEECGVCDLDNDEVRYESDVRWLSEPGFLTMEFRRMDEILHIHLTTAEDFEFKGIMSEEFSVSFGAFKDAVIRESLRILKTYGIKGYFESWSDQRDFPLGMLLTLLGDRPEQKKSGMYTSDLETECKLLQEMIPNKTNDYGTPHCSPEV